MFLGFGVVGFLWVLMALSDITWLFWRHLKPWRCFSSKQGLL